MLQCPQTRQDARSCIGKVTGHVSHVVIEVFSHVTDTASIDLDGLQRLHPLMDD